MRLSSYLFFGHPRLTITHGQKTEICDSDAVKNDFCKEENLGEYILAPDANEKSNNPIITKAIHLKDSQPINYPITKTGYYCVAAYPYNAPFFSGVVEFREAYGELPASQIPKLPFYGGITILYAVIVVYVFSRGDAG